MLTDSKKSGFYQAHLNNVSRSFALCIEQLKEPLKNQIGLAYLICRIIDTVEDSSWANSQQKINHMVALDSFIKNKPTNEEVEKWNRSFPVEIVAQEKSLISDSYQIFTDLHELPSEVRQILQETALSMSRGMTYFFKKTASENKLVLKSIMDVNRYCFFVAGIVGEMLTKFIWLCNPAFEINELSLKRAHQFGLFLQKINLLKDQLDDQKLGRDLVPSHEALWQSLESDLTGAFEYLKAIPSGEREYRLFCAWSLFLGLASTPWIKKSWTLRLFQTRTGWGARRSRRRGPERWPG